MYTHIRAFLGHCVANLTENPWVSSHSAELPTQLAIFGQSSAHSFATGPCVAWVP